MRNFFLLLPVFLVFSCAADKQSDASATPERRSMNQRFRGKTITQDKDGNWPDEVKKEYAMDGDRKSPYFKDKADVPKAYQTGEYAKTSWWGKKEVERQSYTGMTDGSRFKTAARDQGKGAREANTAAKVPDPYQTGTYQTGSARETGVGKLARPADAETENRRGNLDEPEVMGWKQYRALNVNDTKRILGRD